MRQRTLTQPRPKRRLPDPTDIAIGGRIRLERHGAGLSQFALAERLGVSFQQVQKYEQGANRISASMLIKVAQALQCAPGRLLSDEDHAPDEQSQAEVAVWLKFLAQPGARELVEAFVQIPDTRERSAVIAIVHGLRGDSPRASVAARRIRG